MARLIVTPARGLDTTHAPVELPEGSCVHCVDWDFKFGEAKPRPDMAQLRESMSSRAGAVQYPSGYVQLIPVDLPTSERVLLSIEPDPSNAGQRRIRVIRGLAFEGDESGVGFPHVSQSDELVNLDDLSGYIPIQRGTVEWVLGGPYLYLVNAWPKPGSAYSMPVRIDLRTLRGNVLETLADNPEEGWPAARHICLYNESPVVANTLIDPNKIYFADAPTGDGLFTFADDVYASAPGSSIHGVQRLVTLNGKLYFVTDRAWFMSRGLPATNDWGIEKVLDMGTLDPETVKVVEVAGGDGWIHFLGSDGVPYRTSGDFHSLEAIGQRSPALPTSPVEKTMRKYRTRSSIASNIKREAWDSEGAWTEDRVHLQAAEYDDKMNGVRIYDDDVDLGYGQDIGDLEWRVPDPGYTRLEPRPVSWIALWHKLRSSKTLKVDTIRIFGRVNNQDGDANTIFLKIMEAPEPGTAGAFFFEDDDGDASAEVSSGSEQVIDFDVRDEFGEPRVFEAATDYYFYFRTSKEGEKYWVLLGFTGYQSEDSDLFTAEWYDSPVDHDCTDALTPNPAPLGIMKISLIGREYGSSGIAEIGSGHWLSVDAGSNWDTLVVDCEIPEENASIEIRITERGHSRRVIGTLPGSYPLAAVLGSLTTDLKWAVELTQSDPKNQVTPVLRGVYLTQGPTIGVENFPAAEVWDGRYMILAKRNPDVAESHDMDFLSLLGRTYGMTRSGLDRDAIVFFPTGQIALWEKFGAVAACVMSDKLSRQRLVCADRQEVTGRTLDDFTVLLEDRRDPNFRAAVPRFVSGPMFVNAGLVGRVQMLTMLYENISGVGASYIRVLVAHDGYCDDLEFTSDGAPGLRTKVLRVGMNVGRWVMFALGFKLGGGTLIPEQAPLDFHAMTADILGLGYRIGANEGAAPTVPNQNQET